LAEDALADALAAALARWPLDGIPRSPQAWLMTTACRRLIDAGRHDGIHAAFVAGAGGGGRGHAIAVTNSG
jgi:RNA polymerase sigma-70 factor (ECF subfamily)